jgi:hypothetical protein
MKATPKTARNGITQWISVDPLNFATLNWAKHVIEHRLAADATNSTVVRRALQLYRFHLEQLVSPTAPPHDLDSERRQLVAANRGSLQAPSKALMDALPTGDDGCHSIPTLTQLLARPDDTAMDFIKRDLAKWAAADAQAKKDHDTQDGPKS